MRSAPRSETARRGQYLFIGPWDHMSQTGKYPDVDFGAEASDSSSGIHKLHVDFFDSYLRGRPGALDERLPVHIFVMGHNVWRAEAEWPLPDTEYTGFYLDSGGHAATRSGDGLLCPELPQHYLADRYTYDPADPTPTLGGRLLTMSRDECGPRDQSSVEDRLDVLCYTAPPLEAPLEVTGQVSLIIYATSSAVDTDFTGKLVDVHPDGRATYLTDGILRSRYRNSLASSEMLDPGTVYKLHLDLAVTSNVFLAGHCIRLEVSSSNYPRFDRNSNTGGDIVNETEFAVAENAVLHGPDHPSKLVLPVIRR
jgi:putative CocE/NonD family hydrolase